MIDAWCFYSANMKEFTWANKYMTVKSRIYLYLISHSLHNVNNVSHQFAPLPDHEVNLLGLQGRGFYGAWGYRKFNISPLKYSSVNENIISLPSKMFVQTDDRMINKL